MKKIFVILILPIILTIQPKIANAEFEKNKVAVLDFMLQGKGFETEDLGQIVAEWLITALVKQGRFDVVERRLLKKIIAEQQLSETGLLDQETTAQLGKVLGVKVVVSGSVMRLQDIIEVNSRIIDVESGSILAAESVKNEDASRLKNLVEEMAQKIINAFPLEGYVVNRQRERVTIDLGRTSGVKSGMKFIVYKEGEVIKHPKTGEVLDVQKIQTGIIDIYKVLDKLSEGSIIKETEPDAIIYGQLVKSSSKDIKLKSLSKNLKIDTSNKEIKVQKGTLNIDAIPANSKIRILNIKPKFIQGMNLDPGNYLIEVKCPSYQTKTQWITILPGQENNASIVLEKFERRKDTQAKLDESKAEAMKKAKSGKRRAKAKSKTDLQKQSDSTLSKDLKTETPNKEIKVQKGTLNIDAMPTNSKIRILNIKPKFIQGMNLDPGNYLVEVKCPSYQTKTQWIKILPGQEKNISIVLEKFERRKNTQAKLDESKAEAMKKAKAGKRRAKAKSKPDLRKPSGSRYSIAIFPSNTTRNHEDWCYKVHDEISRAAIGVVRKNPGVELKYSQFKKVGNLNKKGLEKWWGKTSFFGTHKPHIPTVIKYAKKVGVELVLMYDYGWEYYIGDFKPFYVYLIDTKTSEIFDVSEIVDIDIAPLKVKELTNRVVNDFIK